MTLETVTSELVYGPEQWWRARAKPDHYWTYFKKSPALNLPMMLKLIFLTTKGIELEHVPDAPKLTCSMKKNGVQLYLEA